MKNYLLNEIKLFHQRTIPLFKYPSTCREIRDKINRYIDLELLYIKRMYLKEEISKEDYHYLTVITKYNKWKYHQLVN